ncbi:MAG: hypothetical protein KGQ41_07975 [Alphaproteobacteria bacterium]|nr:hypothetical protein [Alphaproteobacteria bacterium]
MNKAKKPAAPAQLTLDDIPNDLRVQILTEGFISKRGHEGQTHVIKIGGRPVEDTVISGRFCEQTAIARYDIGVSPVVIHGAGDKITAAIKELLKEESDFDRRGRISRANHMDVIKSIMMKANEGLCETFREAAARVHVPVVPLGIGAFNGNLIVATPFDAAGNNFSGSPVRVNTTFLRAVLADKTVVPFIYTMCHSDRVYTHEDKKVTKINVNADTAGAAIMIALNADRYYAIIDKPGVLDADGKVIPRIREDEVEDLKKSGVIHSGMVTKLDNAVDIAVETQKPVFITDENWLGDALTIRGRGTEVVASPSITPRLRA